MLINIGLMGLIWYCAHKLTWDCTMVDESQDASGEGLLQRLGLDKKEASGASADEPRGPALASRRGRDRAAKTGRGRGGSGSESAPAAPLAGPLGHLVLAGGLGRCSASASCFIPAATCERRRRRLSMLFIVYVACALGLLLTTSFLGLRRYLAAAAAANARGHGGPVDRHRLLADRRGAGSCRLAAAAQPRIRGSPKSPGR